MPSIAAEYGIACCPEFGEASSYGSGFAIDESNGVASNYWAAKSSDFNI
jgi:hypothetical protein